MQSRISSQGRLVCTRPSDFLFDICTRSILWESSPRLVPHPGRILRADVNLYKSKYSKVLEQLVNGHKIFENVTDIMVIPGVALDEYDMRMNN